MNKIHWLPVLACILRILNHFFLLYLGTRLCEPKTTFTKVPGLDRNLGYPEIYVSVRWYLYPDIPNSTIKSYRGVVDRYGGGKKYIEIVEHKTCLCDQPHKSPVGYNAISKAYVHIHNHTWNFNNGETKTITYAQYSNNMIRYESQIGDKLEKKNWNKQSYSNSNLLHLKLIPKGRGNIWEIRHSSAWHMRNTPFGSFPNHWFEVAKRYNISKFLNFPFGFGKLKG